MEEKKKKTADGMIKNKVDIKRQINVPTDSETEYTCSAAQWTNSSVKRKNALSKKHQREVTAAWQVSWLTALSALSSSLTM